MSDAPSPRLIFFGTADFSLPPLEKLIEQGFAVVGVVTKPDSAAGRNRPVSPPAVKTLAEAHSIPVLQPHKLGDALDEIKALEPDMAVVVSYGKIIPTSIIDLFDGNMINIHASLLPKYRGASPIEAAILHGDAVTGVSLMRIEEGLDTGAVYVAKELALTGSETKPDLYDKLSHFGAATLGMYLRGIIDGSIIANPQDDAGASVAPIISKADGVIDWTKPADVLEREVRAYLGWPGSRTKLLGREVTITASHVQHAPYSLSIVSSAAQQPTAPGDVLKLITNELAIVTGSTDVLVIDQLKPAGKKEMTGMDFLRGHR